MDGGGGALQYMCALGGAYSPRHLRGHINLPIFIIIYFLYFRYCLFLQQLRSYCLFSPYTTTETLLFVFTIYMLVATKI